MGLREYIVAGLLWASLCAGSPFHFYTENAYNYHYISNMGVDIRTLPHVTFEVMACNDVHVALSSAENDATNTYEIVLGGWANTKSVIRDRKQGPALAEANHIPLDCGKYKAFWVSWDGGHVQVGTGNVVGQGKFLDLATTAYKVNYLAIATGWGATGHWIFNLSPTFNFFTPNNYNYQYLDNKGVTLIGRNGIYFQVKSSNDAHVALSASNGVDTTNTYEIVLGGWGNTKSVIRDCKQCTNLASATHTPLNSNEYRQFWVTWENGVIRVGTGYDKTQGQFMSWADPTPHLVNYIAVSSGWGATGKWIF